MKVEWDDCGFTEPSTSLERSLPTGRLMLSFKQIRLWGGQDTASAKAAKAFAGTSSSTAKPLLPEGICWNLLIGATDPRPWQRNRRNLLIFFLRRCATCAANETAAGKQLCCCQRCKDRETMVCYCSKECQVGHYPPHNCVCCAV